MYIYSITYSITMNKYTILFGLLLVVGMFLNVVSPLTVSAQDSPYSFGWWYKQQVYDTVTTDDDDDNNKDSNNDRLDKKLCANSGVWNGKECIISDPVEKAAYEDAVCDDPKDTKKYTSVCGGGGSDKDDDKIYKDFEKQYKKQHPEFYPKSENPAEEKSDRVSGIASQVQEEQEKKLHDTTAPSLKSLEGKNFDDVVKHNDDKDDNNDNDDSNDNNNDDGKDSNDDSSNDDDGGNDEPDSDEKDSKN